MTKPLVTRRAKRLISLLSENLLKLLRQYYKEYHPKQYPFEGHNIRKTSPISVANLLKKASFKAWIRKDVTPPLRHSFATYLLEQGTNFKVYLRVIEA